MENFSPQLLIPAGAVTAALIAGFFSFLETGVETGVVETGVRVQFPKPRNRGNRGNRGQSAISKPGSKPGSPFRRRMQ